MASICTISVIQTSTPGTNRQSSASRPAMKSRESGELSGMRRRGLREISSSIIACATGSSRDQSLARSPPSSVHSEHLRPFGQHRRDRAYRNQADRPTGYGVSVGICELRWGRVPLPAVFSRMNSSADITTARGCSRFVTRTASTSAAPNESGVGPGSAPPSCGNRGPDAPVAVHGPRQRRLDNRADLEARTPIVKS